MMRATNLYVWILLLGMLVSAPVAADGIFQLNDIYAAQVPVAEQSQAALKKAFPAALAKVVVRVTGDTRAPSAQGMSQVLKHADNLVQSYRYVGLGNNQQGQSGGQSLAVRVRFDDDAVNKLIRAHGLPIWGRERPRTLVWLGVRGDNRRGIVGADDASETAAGLVNTALARGVPVVFPLMDLQDQHAVSGADVWGGFFDPIETASKRYPHSDVVVVNGQQGNRGWQSDWTLLSNGKITSQWSTSGSSLNAVLAQGMSRLANRYAQSYAVAKGQGGTQTLRVVVDDVRDAADYARVSNYLSGLTAVQALQLDAVNGKQLIFSLTTSGNRDYLRRVISLDGMLKVADGSPASESVSATPGGGSTAAASGNGGGGSGAAPAAVNASANGNDAATIGNGISSPVLELTLQHGAEG